jgi:hypothetical protein
MCGFSIVPSSFLGYRERAARHAVVLISEVIMPASREVVRVHGTSHGATAMVEKV